MEAVKEPRHVHRHVACYVPTKSEEYVEFLSRHAGPYFDLAGQGAGIHLEQVCDDLSDILRLNLPGIG